VTGYLLPKLGVDGILTMNIVLAVMAGVALTFLGKLPEIEKVTVKLNSNEENSSKNAQISALKMPGVLEAIANDGEGKVYLQVDKSKVQQKDLLSLGTVER